ncbi:MAG: carbohydrate ABC transporter permease [bacterium]|jgi:N-acetylglucosamine transport system permease protein|nr:carbohydrate ABC transporter permease [Pseudomonadota bacterium]RZO47131.1 MAG: carbohydrate ABC transporter permease [Pseudomonadota bacterium]HBM54532.1 sugar ABC transporter permease [Deltaproteobacteria bacterium]|tara:strand:+ start:3451 stop:4287 length:837 start_codon:yes stop_codon:yes gene_type:complete
MYQVSRWSAVSTQTVLIGWAVTVIFPMIWMIYSSFKTDQELFFSPWAPPVELQWDNFARAWTKAHVGDYLLNTLIVVVPALLLTLIISAMAAYVLARFEFVGRRFLFYMFLSGMLFPVFLALVPLFNLVNQLKMLNTFHGLILVYIAYSLPFTIFFLTGFFKTLPTEIEESAIMDGANPYQVFFKVMLPMASPGLISMGIFNFLGMWNQYVLPLVLISDESKYMLSQGLAFMLFKQFYENDWSALFAALTIIMVPTLIVYITFQKQIQDGITTGALKG